MLLLPQLVFDVFFFKLPLNFLPSGPHKSTGWDFLIFDITIFHDFFCENFTFSIVPYMYRETKNCSYLERSHRRAKLSEIWASSVSIQCIQGTFDS